MRFAKERNDDRQGLSNAYREPPGRAEIEIVGEDNVRRRFELPPGVVNRGEQRRRSCQRRLYRDPRVHVSAEQLASAVAAAAFNQEISKRNRGIGVEAQPRRSDAILVE